MTGPSAVELVLYVMELQPELDEAAAVRLIQLDDMREAIESHWRTQRQLAQNLLDLHLALEEQPA